MLKAAPVRDAEEKQEAAPSGFHCWLCGRSVLANEPTIAHTVCARCYDELHEHWR